MAESTSDPIGGEQLRNNRSTVRGGSWSRHDIVLAVIPLAFTVAMLIGLLFSVPLNVTMFGASLLAGLAVVDSVFWNPPV